MGGLFSHFVGVYLLHESSLDSTKQAQQTLFPGGASSETSRTAPPFGPGRRRARGAAYKVAFGFWRVAACVFWSAEPGLQDRLSLSRRHLVFKSLAARAPAPPQLTLCPSYSALVGRLDPWEARALSPLPDLQLPSLYGPHLPPPRFSPAAPASPGSTPTPAARPSPPLSSPFHFTCRLPLPAAFPPLLPDWLGRPRLGPRPPCLPAPSTAAPLCAFERLPGSPGVGLFCAR